MTEEDRRLSLGDVELVAYAEKMYGLIHSGIEDFYDISEEASQRNLDQVDLPSSEEVTRMGFPDRSSVDGFSGFWNDYLKPYISSAVHLIDEEMVGKGDIETAQKKALGATVWWSEGIELMDPQQRDAFFAFRDAASSFHWDKNYSLLGNLSEGVNDIGEGVAFFAKHHFEVRDRVQNENS